MCWTCVEHVFGICCHLVANVFNMCWRNVLKECVENLLWMCWTCQNMLGLCWTMFLKLVEPVMNMYTANVLNVFTKSAWDVLNMYCNDNVLRMLWTFVDNVLNMWSTCVEHVLQTFRHVLPVFHCRLVNMMYLGTTRACENGCMQSVCSFSSLGCGFILWVFYGCYALLVATQGWTSCSLYGIPHRLHFCRVFTCCLWSSSLHFLGPWLNRKM